MNSLFPILAAVLQAGSFTIDKLTLSIKQVTYKTYTGVSFPLIFAVTFVIFLIFRPPLNSEFFKGNLGLLIFASIILSIITNLIFYRALDDDKLGEIETLDIFSRVTIILFSGLIFTDERNLFLIIPALIASLAIIWSHWEHHHFKIARYTLPFFLWSIITAPIAASISKILLQSWHPISLEFVRSGALAIFLGPMFFKYSKHVPIKALHLLILTNILTSIAWILFYFSYQRSGIVYTILLFSLQPLLVYFSAVFFLKEKFILKKALAFVIVLASITIAQIWR